uniref:Protein kinase domain-containing protein n=1 Tax=Parastrongyloides trichosuri TaxID=131310 RepID=A0A0N4Z2C9_PARTI
MDKNQKYLLLEKIDKGYFSNVYKSRNYESGKLVALKQIYVVDNVEKCKNIVKEIMILKNLDNKNIIQYIGCFEKLKKLYLVMEFIPWNLRNLMNNCYDKNFIMMGKKLFKDILNGLDYINNCKLIHCDLKPENILIGEEFIARIGDFGQTIIDNDDEKSPNVGTRWYKSIELLLGSKNYTNSVDIWSFGCILSEWYRRYPIFNGLTDLEQIYQIVEKCGVPNIKDYPDWENLPDVKKLSFTKIDEKNKLESELEHIPCDVRDVIKVMLVINPSKRITTSELFSMKYFLEDTSNFEGCNSFKKLIMEKEKNLKNNGWKKIILSPCIDLKKFII